MMNNISNVNQYNYFQSDEILIDANIWLLLYSPPSKPVQGRADKYSDAFKKMMGCKSQPIIDPFVMSEYINSYCRIEWKAREATYPDYKKDFRESTDFEYVADNAYSFANEILRLCSTYDVRICDINLSWILSEFKTGKLDFNDGILIDICKKKNYKLMTDDGDFTTGGITVLTANPRLLRANS